MAVPARARSHNRMHAHNRTPAAPARHRPGWHRQKPATQVPRRRQLLGQVFLSEVQAATPLKPMDLQRCFSASPVSCTSHAAPERVRGPSHLKSEQ